MTIPIPVLLVQDENDELVEVYAAEELTLWWDGDGIDVMHDMTSIRRAFRRKDGTRWERIDIVSLAEILRKTPGVKVWTGKGEPPLFDTSAKGWEVVG